MGARVPDHDLAVVTPGDDPPAVGAEGHAEYGTCMAAEGEDFLAGRGVPELDSTVIAGRSQAPAVGATGHPSHPPRVPAKLVEQPTRGEAPDLHFDEGREERSAGRGDAAADGEEHRLAH